MSDNKPLHSVPQQTLREFVNNELKVADFQFTNPDLPLLSSEKGFWEGYREAFKLVDLYLKEEGK